MGSEGIENEFAYKTAYPTTGGPTGLAGVEIASPNHKITA
jgi:hypothetical protein